jgi:hypothetical protein
VLSYFFKNHQHLTDDEQEEGFTALVGAFEPFNSAGKKWNSP